VLLLNAQITAPVMDFVMKPLVFVSATNIILVLLVILPIFRVCPIIVTPEKETDFVIELQEHVSVFLLGLELNARLVYA